jgi:signal transduction histidine kinase
MPIREMALTASEISGRSLEKRMPVSGRNYELDQLAISFNEMLARIDTLIFGIRESAESLAHDLRTPITGIRGVAEVTLNGNRDTQEYRVALYKIIEQMDRLLLMSNSILDVSEAEAGALVLANEAVSIDELCNNIILTFEPVALDKRLQFQSSIAPGLEVIGDRGRLFQALANLLDNAVKYTPSGGSIMLAACKSPEGDEVVISAADSGPGISGKDLPHIFERYYRGDRSRSGSGAGLGLPLVQGIVKAHGGRLFVDSKEGEGSVFSIYLPLVQGSTEPTPGA